MPEETKSSAIYRPDLGQAVMEFVEEASVLGYIGLQVMPIFPTPLASSSYPVIPKEMLLKVPNVDRAPRSAYPRGDWKYERGFFATSERGFEEPVDDVERALLDQEAPGTADLVATQRAMNHIMRAQEIRIAGTLFNSTNFTAHNLSTEWSSASTAVPINDVNDAKLAFVAQCGMAPDALIISYKVFLNLIVCSQIVDRIKYTFPMIDMNNISSAQMAQCLGVPRVLIGGAIYDSAAKGVAASITDIWDDEYAALVKIGAGLDLTRPCVGRTFLWTADSPQNAVVEQYREESLRSDIFRVRHNVSEELIASRNTSGTIVSNISAACMYLMANVTA